MYGLLSSPTVSSQSSVPLTHELAPSTSLVPGCLTLIPCVYPLAKAWGHAFKSGQGHMAVNTFWTIKVSGNHFLLPAQVQRSISHRSIEKMQSQESLSSTWLLDELSYLFQIIYSKSNRKKNRCLHAVVEGSRKFTKSQSAFLSLGSW